MTFARRLPFAAGPLALAALVALAPVSGQAQDAADRLLTPGAAQTPAPAQPTDQDLAAEAARQAAEREARLRALGESYRRAPDERQDPQELVRTRILNAEIRAQNDLAEDQERADRAAYEEAAARHSEALSRAETERLNHEAELRAAQAAQVRYESDMNAWRARVRACEAGDRRACQGW